MKQREDERPTIKMESTYVNKSLAARLQEKYKDGVPSDAPELKGTPNMPETPRCEYCGKAMPFTGYLRTNWIVWVTTVREACTCPQAQAEFAKLEEEWAEQERQAQERRKKQHIEKLFEQSGLSARNRLQTFERWEAREEKMRHVKRMVEGYKDMALRGELDKNDGLNSLFLHGTCGSGKTHLACAVANAMLDAEKPVLLTTFGDIMQEIKSTYSREAKTTELQIVSKYRKAPMLIIDDLGKEKPTDWSASVLFSILNHRYSDMKPTIITSNFAPEVTINRIAPSQDDALCGRSIVSRIAEVYSIINVSTEDHRAARK